MWKNQKYMFENKYESLKALRLHFTELEMFIFNYDI